MRAEAVLAVRLAMGATRAGRRRALLTALAAVAGTAVFLMVLAVANADRAAHPERYTDDGMDRVLAVIVLVIGLQVAALAATAGRMAASVRARRLGNLRLLGLSVARTRLIAAVETGLAATLGAIAGAGVFEAIRPVVGRLRIANASWSTDALDPGWVGRVVTVVAVVCFTVALAVLPERLSARESLGGARGTTARRPSVLRLVPLIAGTVGCAWFRARSWDDGDIPLLLASIAALGFGVILVVPVFVRLVAEALVRFGRGGVATIAGRRLQAQPASMNRVVTGLLLGLFLVTGARLVVVAFESTSQYRGAARQIDERQLVSWTTTLAEAEIARAPISAVAGVRGVMVLPTLSAYCGSDGDECGVVAIAATCEQVAQLYPGSSGCLPGTTQAIVEADGEDTVRSIPNAWQPIDDQTDAPTERILDVPVASEPIVVPDGSAWFGTGIVVTAPDAQLSSSTARGMIFVFGDPGRDLPGRLATAGYPEAFAPWDPSDYDLVATLRTAVLAVGMTVLAIGLLAFAVAAIDRTMQRRADAVALQLVGVPGSLLRRVQWIEAGIPIVGGSALAIGAGLLAGSAYLGLDDLPVPWRSIAALTAAAAIGGGIVAGITVAAANPSIDADTIRRA